MSYAPHSDPAQATDPLHLWDQWLAEATASEPNDPNAAALATATTGAVPSVRMVLVKPIDRHPFCFFTNSQSRKGGELTQNPHVALCFHWKSLRRQVRVEGPITLLSSEAADAYFHSRSRKSQLGAAASRQSQPLASREVLEEAVRQLTAVTPAVVPRPPHWLGYQLNPTQIEFWIDGPARLHDRFLFTQVNGEWQKSRLYP
jgi:pyridoxamine 5'-phosphate oxidase